MTGISDYAKRVPYYRRLHAANRAERLAQFKAYRKHNREAIKIAKGMGVPIPEARKLLNSLLHQQKPRA